MQFLSESHTIDGLAGSLLIEECCEGLHVDGLNVLDADDGGDLTMFQ